MAKLTDDDRAVARDCAMARLAGALASLDAARESVSGALMLFVNPEDDKRGKERKDLVETALEAVGAATRGLESADEEMSDADMAIGEPWDDEEEEDEDEEEDEENEENE